MTDIEPLASPVVVTTVRSPAGPYDTPKVTSAGNPTPAGVSETSTGGATTIVYVNPPAAVVAPGSGAASGAGYELPRPSRKGASLLTAYALFFFFGWTGMHQVYLGNTLRGVSYIFTFSWFTLALWIDLFTLPSQVRRVNTERMLGLR